MPDQPDPGPARLVGRPASHGYAEGVLFTLDGSGAGYAVKSGPDAEMEALRTAIAAASASLSRLITEAGRDAAEMLEFQAAMLEDDALSAPAFAAIGTGATADAAWRVALNGEIAGYEASPDEYFRARAVDLRDIRDRVWRALVGGSETGPPKGAILFGEDLAPTRFVATDWSGGGGIALSRGSAASHVAMLARARGVPMVVGLSGAQVSTSGMVLLDAEHGELVAAPSEADVARFNANRDRFLASRVAADAWVSRPGRTRSGEAVAVRINVADPADLAELDVSRCDGVGLMRTEFLFGGTRGLPDEETQLAAYARVLAWAQNRPVTVRTVDAGGDKPVEGLTVAETNPFLGLRGIRLSLARPDVFRVQIRALLRAACHGDLKVMLPMVAVPDEFDRAAALFNEEHAALDRASVPNRMPALGIMVETPAAAISPELFARAAFFSIGSNDLTQYTMAAARDNDVVAALNDVRHPSVLRLIRSLVDFGKVANIPVSLCGDAGGDPAALPDLLRAGLRDISVAPAQLAQAKQSIGESDI